MKQAQARGSGGACAQGSQRPGARLVQADQGRKEPRRGGDHECRHYAAGLRQPTIGQARADGEPCEAQEQKPPQRYKALLDDKNSHKPVAREPPLHQRPDQEDQRQYPDRARDPLNPSGAGLGYGQWLQSQVDLPGTRTLQPEQHHPIGGVCRHLKSEQHAAQDVVGGWVKVTRPTANAPCGVVEIHTIQEGRTHHQYPRRSLHTLDRWHMHTHPHRLRPEGPALPP